MTGLLSRREAAQAIAVVREEQEPSAHRALVENVIWSMYDGFEEVGVEGVELSEEDVDEIMASMPSPYDSDGW